MTIRAKKPDETPEKAYRLKLFLYGPEKIGKTTAALQFPDAYIIDSEGATEYPFYRSLIRKSNSASVIIRDFENLYENVNYLLHEKHPYKTLVIDSLSPIYTKLVEDNEQIVGQGFGKAHGIANKNFKRLMNLIMELDLNVIATSHARTDYLSDGTINPNQTYDCYKKMGYCFATIGEIQKRGTKRYMTVRGSWLQNFSEGDTFEFSYDEIIKRFPIEQLERDAAIVETASIEDLMELKILITDLNISLSVQQVWLDRAEVTSFDKMRTEDMVKLLSYLHNKQGVI